MTLVHRLRRGNGAGSAIDDSDGAAVGGLIAALELGYQEASQGAWMARGFVAAFLEAGGAAEVRAHPAHLLPPQPPCDANCCISIDGLDGQADRLLACWLPRLAHSQQCFDTDSRGLRIVCCHSRARIGVTAGCTSTMHVAAAG